MMKPYERMKLSKEASIALRHYLYEFYYRGMSGGGTPPEGSCKCEGCKAKKKKKGEES